MTPAAKTAATLVTGLLLAGCGSGGGGGTGLGPVFPSSWSSAGLTYDPLTSTFKGIPETPYYQVPTSGSARFSGEYRYTTASVTQARGPAQLDINFQTSGVTLSVSGVASGVSTGTIYGGTFYSNSTGFIFTGKLYGAGANVAAGNLTNAGTIGVGQFIVKR